MCLTKFGLCGRWKLPCAETCALSLSLNYSLLILQVSAGGVEVEGLEPAGQPGVELEAAVRGPGRKMQQSFQFFGQVSSQELKKKMSQ